MNGYTGRILRVDLTDRKVSTLDTKDYDQWGGGHGIGSALFWDIARDKAISGFDPRNVVTIMTSPLAGTLVPGGAGRTEVQGIGVQSSPVEWFTRSNVGGRFAAMLKYAGWDGVVVEGKADRPVWIDIRDEEVQVRDAGALWGKDTWETQAGIWREISTDNRYSGWEQKGSTEEPGRSTQRPAVLTIGPAGENLCRIASLIHDAGHGSGQGGFGAVWGSKNLKAISVVGTRGIKVADPKGLIDAWLWAMKNYSCDVDDPSKVKRIKSVAPVLGFGAAGLPSVFWRMPKRARPHACIGCHRGCGARHGTGQGNESYCGTTLVYSFYDQKRHNGWVLRAITSLLERFSQLGLAGGINMMFGRQTSAAFLASDLANRYGINTFELSFGLPYLVALNKKGLLGHGKDIDCDLPFDRLGEVDFAEELLHKIAYREDIGDDIAEGFYRAAERWGRLEEDLETGLLPYAIWGLPDHQDARAEVEWGYGSILGERDINEHDFVTPLYLMPSMAKWSRKKPALSAEEVTRIISEKLTPYEGDPQMLDYSTENIYSEHIAKLVAWHRHYTRFWKQSVLYCDYRFADFYNPNAPDKRGMTGEGEPRFFNAVTGKGLSFADGIEIGRRIWNLDNAIWALQGRHRDMVHFASYIYNVPFHGGGSLTKYFMPGRRNGKWEYITLEGRCIDRAKFEDWKTKFYELEGWDPVTGWPTKSTLESLGLGYVANEMEKRGRLGIGSSSR